jgi:uroporphyrinogen-III synthase
MQPNKPRILITAEVDRPLVDALIAKDCKVEVLPFITTESKNTASLRKQINVIAEQDIVVVFTSSNAVKAVQALLQNKNTSWKIYCVGKATKKLIDEYFPGCTILGVEDYADALAQKIIRDKKAGEIFFFCGNMRRDVLPALLSENNIALHAIEVYETKIYQHTISGSFDGITFFSPSAVEGFFAGNSIPAATVLFAIGQTTADAIKTFSGNQIIVSNTTGKKELIEAVIAFFAV